MGEMKNNTQIKGNTDSLLKSTLLDFKDLVKKPEVYLSIQDRKAEKIKTIVKSLYDYNKLISRNDVNKLKKGSLPELIVNDMDEEQIWQQLELQNNDIVNENLTQVAQILSISDEKYTISQESEEEQSGDDNEEYLEEPMHFEKNNVDVSEEDENELDQNENVFESNENNEHEVNMTRNKFGGDRASIVDDQFFKLHEMKQFLDDEDRKEMRRSQGKYNDEDDDNYDDEGNEIDMFNDIRSDDDDDNEASPENLKYNGFFGEEDEDSKISRRLKEKQKINKNRKKMRDEDLGNEDDYESDEEGRQAGVKFNMNDNEYYSDDQNTNELQDSNDDENEPKSSFEVREKRLKSRIKQMEKNSLQEKSWQLRGEIDAEKRPLNSLLEEVLDYDSAVRPAPVITEETTMKLEDIIKQRIKNKAFDDVVRKIRPAETPQEYRKKLILDQEKSKDSLVTVYEKEYLKQVTELTKNSEDVLEQQPKAHQEISNQMKTLFAKLDALSNFYYTPKSAAPEVKIITNTPAIFIEDLQPTAVSNATLLAPEEVHRKSDGDLIGKGERTKTDKNRDLRKKKTKQKFINRKINEKNIKNHVNDDKLLSKLTKSRNIDKMNQTDSNKSVKSSKAFFTQLQESVTQKKSVGQNVQRKNDKNTKTPSMLKL